MTHTTKKSSRQRAVGIIVAAACAASAIVSVTTSSALSLTSFAASASGDVNGDGNVDGSDVAALQNYILGKSKLSNASEADLTGDGIVNGADLTALRQTVNGGIIYIHLKDSGITVEGDTIGATSISGKTVTVSMSGTYYVDGSITNGQIYVETEDTDTESVDLFLTGVDMTSSSAACIYAANNKAKLKITFSGENTLTDTATSAYADCGVIYAESDITLTKNSTGTLDILSSYNNGIYTSDDLKINGGTIYISTDEGDSADADAIKCKETVEIEGGTITIDSSADGIKSTKEDVVIEDGTISIKAGNDAIQASTDLTISGGDVVACGDRGLRLDNGYTLNITGGSVVATGTDYGVNLDSSETYDTSGSTQTIMQFAYADEQKKNTDAVIQQSGKTVFTATPVKKYDYLLVSDPSLSSSGTYTFYTDSTQMTHSTSTDGSFKNSSAFTNFLDVKELSGGATLDPSTSTSSGDEATAITFSNSGITAYDDSGATISSPSNLSISGTTVTITKESEIDVEGSCSNGQIIVDVDKTSYPDAVVTLNLKGLSLTNTNGAALLVESIGDTVEVSAKNNTTNSLADGSNYTATDSTGDSITAAVYSRDDLKFKGKGELTITGNKEDGIVCKDDLKFWNGNITVVAQDEGIRGNDTVRIGDPDDDDYSSLILSVTTYGGDGIRTKSTDEGEGYIRINGGTVNVTCAGDTGDAFQAKQAFYMYGGDVNIKTYDGYTYTGSGSSTGQQGNTGVGQQGGNMMDEGNNNATENSCKGIKTVGLYADEDASDPVYASEGNIIIYDGNITINSSDDCIHSAGNVYLYGGTYDLRSADDGIHSDNTLYIGQTASDDTSTPYIQIGYSYEGVEGVDIVMNCGTCLVYSTDDGFNAAGGSDTGNSSTGNTGGGFNSGNGMNMNEGYQTLTFNGGYTFVNSNGGDGVDSNGDMYFNGGYVFVSENDSNNEPIDYGDSNNVCNYNGGIVVAVGNGSAMSEMPSNAVFDYGSSMGMGGGMGGSTSYIVSAGQTVSVVDNTTNSVIAVMTVPHDVSMMTVCADISGTATVYAGATVSGATYFPGFTNCDYDSVQNRCGYGGTSSGGSQLTSDGTVSGGTAGDSGPQDSGSQSGNQSGGMTGSDQNNGGAPGSSSGGTTGGTTGGGTSGGGAGR